MYLSPSDLQIKPSFRILLSLTKWNLKDERDMSRSEIVKYCLCNPNDDDKQTQRWKYNLSGRGKYGQFALVYYIFLLSH